MLRDCKIIVSRTHKCQLKSRLLYSSIPTIHKLSVNNMFMRNI